MNPSYCLAFYGDDFTGSTDALAFLEEAGIKTILFFEPPTLDILQKYPHIQAFGVAGMSRAMSPEQMQKQLNNDFAQLCQLPVKHIHYKVCSTFDSAPHIGNIGVAIEIGLAVFQHRFVPIVVTAPALGRYVLFGNLFARMGIGSQGEMYRLDRHPSMQKHPITPANEADLRLHLGKQTSLSIGLLDILQVAQPLDILQNKLKQLLDNQDKIVFIDALNEDNLTHIGGFLEQQIEPHKPFFSVGSSGVEVALSNHWQKQGLFNPPTAWQTSTSVDTLLVISGSCSPVTSQQIAWACDNGFESISLDTEQLTNELAYWQPYAQQAIACIEKGRSVIIHSSPTTNHNLGEAIPAHLIGYVLGMIAKATIEATRLKRLLIAGGDTSSYAARALGIEAIEMLHPLFAGAPLCRAISSNDAINGLEVNVKGGQVGSESYFGIVAQGGSHT